MGKKIQALIKNGQGLLVHKRLVELGIETPMKWAVGGNSEHYRPHASRMFSEIMKGLNLDLKDDSLKETPNRMAKMYCDEIFYGLNYENFPKCTVIENRMKYDEMVSQKCSVMSTCEHHLVPFVGTAHVAYIPGTKVIGLSKINRLVDFFARRPQVQERLTVQICSALQLILETEDVAVIIAAEHFCVKLRGVKDEQSHTITSKMSGRFMSKPALRAEFLDLAR